MVAVQIEPLPAEGQEVSLRGKLCMSQDCNEVETHFTVGPPDTEAPAGAAPSLWFDLHDHADDDGLDSCGEGPSFVWFFHLEGMLEASAEAPLVYTLTAFKDNALDTSAWIRRMAAPDLEATFRISGSDEMVMPYLPGAYCFRVDVSDLAGNPGPSSEVVCTPCHYRADASEDAVENFSEEDVYPGGMCAGGETNPEEPVVIEGCQCRAGAGTGAGTGAGGSGLWLGALPFAAWRARRRRAARGTR